MAIEKYIAAASLGLFVMFVAETITVYTFIIDPKEGLEAIEPAPKMWQFISIGVAPAVIMASVSFIMVKSSGLPTKRKPKTGRRRAVCCVEIGR